LLLRAVQRPPAAAARSVQQSISYLISISYPQGRAYAANPPHAAAAGNCGGQADRQTDSQTDGRTPCRYIDPAAHTMRAVPTRETSNELSLISAP